MEFTISEEVLKDIVVTEYKKAVAIKVKEAFNIGDRWSSGGDGVQAVAKILREYLETIDFKDIVEEEIKKIMKPEVESIVRGYLAKEIKIVIKQILSEQPKNESVA